MEVAEEIAGMVAVFDDGVDHSDDAAVRKGKDGLVGMSVANFVKEFANTDFETEDRFFPATRDFGVTFFITPETECGKWAPTSLVVAVGAFEQALVILNGGHWESGCCNAGSFASAFGWRAVNCVEMQSRDCRAGNLCLVNTKVIQWVFETSTEEEWAVGFGVAVTNEIEFSCHIITSLKSNIFYIITYFLQ